MLIAIALSSALSSAVSAAPVPAALRARVTPAAIDLAELQAEALDPMLQEDELIAKKVDCWDTLGVLDFNLDVPIDDVELTLGDGTLSVVVEFGTIHGEDMLVFGLDEDYFDTCPEFDSDLHYATVTDGRLEATLAASRGADGKVLLDWVETPVLTGDLDTDFSWFPDDLVLYFIEETIFESVGAAVADVVPPALEALLADAVMEGEYGDFDMGLALAEVSLEPDGLYMTADADIRFVGTTDCEVDTSGQSASGGSGVLPLSDEGANHIGLGLTEAMVNELLYAGWASGAFCIPSESAANLVADLSSLVGPDTVTGAAFGRLDSPPVLALTEQGMQLQLTGQHVVVEGTVDGDPTVLLDVELDVVGTATLTLDPDLGSVVLSVTDLQTDTVSLSLDGLQTGVEGIVGTLLDGLIASSLEDDLRRIPLFDGQYRGFGLIMRLDRFVAADDGMAVWLRLYDEDDPEVDQEAPSTSAELVEVDGTTAQVAWTATDDRDDPLAFSWQLDSTGWSAWTDTDGVTIEGLDAGDHLIEVKARDAWLNEDPTPVSLTATVSEGASNGLGGDCGCNSGGVGGLWAAFVGLLALGRRRVGVGGDGATSCRDARHSCRASSPPDVASPSY